MGTEKKSKLNPNNLPGPGQYNLSSKLGEGPKFSMSTKTLNIADPAKYIVSPGPGNYSPNFNNLFRNFSYSMRSRPNTSKPEAIPGPGSYVKV